MKQNALNPLENSENLHDDVRDSQKILVNELSAELKKIPCYKYWDSLENSYNAVSSLAKSSDEVLLNRDETGQTEQHLSECVFYKPKRAIKTLISEVLR